MSVVKISTKNFDSEVINSQTPVLVDFFAEWCGPCKMLSPIIDDIAEQMKSKIKIGKIDIDESPDLASKFSVMTVPTLILFKDGEAVEKSVGVKSKDAIIEMISK